MDRFAIMVDAGYLYASAGELCCGTTKRKALALDPEKASRSLVEICRKHSDQEHLRTYWYDGAPDAVPTAEQLEIGGQQGVKLRLGRLTPHGQKGVDSRIVRDLIVLPRNGAVDSIYLLSGDEDVREGVAEAQELGVYVVLIGIEPVDGRFNQAATLVREADDLIVLGRSDCSKFMQKRTSLPEDITDSLDVSFEGGSPEEFGAAYGKTLRKELEPDVVGHVLSNRPEIPRSVDWGLLKVARDQLGDEPVDDEPTRRAIRSGFWDGLGETISGPDDGGLREDTAEEEYDES